MRPVLIEQQACSCSAGRPIARATATRAVGGKRDAVEAGHHRVGVGDAPVHAGRPRAAEQHLAVGQPPPRLQEDPPDVRGRRRHEGAGLRVERHHDHQHQRMDRDARRDDVERRGLAEDAPVVQADDDVRHHLHRRRAQRRQRRLEILDRAVEVVDLADGLVARR